MNCIGGEGNSGRGCRGEGWMINLLWGFVLAMILMIFTLSFSALEEKSSYDVSTNLPTLADQFSIHSFLRMPVGGGETVMDAILLGDDITAEVTDIVRESFSHSEELCWNIRVDDERVLEVDCDDRFPTPLFDSRVVLPTQAGDAVEVRFIIPGVTS